MKTMIDIGKNLELDDFINGIIITTVFIFVYIYMSSKRNQ